ncbi:VanZ family protein [Pelomonas sp. CA6]|uniref:VanZ family protein n=1 Tax=Pelomonas sp. CA6 TaxID=2907999 RepID=UPI001F4BE754|nr:VanZ family protein [Pelomonas sp. CA6]MCH7344176.1 VanZ family protein [Pelomonas sp. CA6]
MSAAPQRLRRRLGWALAAYVFFIVYGSLVPLEYRDASFEAAWARFTQAQLLDLGIESRADWIANGVLYVPLGLLGALLLRARGASALAAALTTGVLGTLLALGVEFTQTFFPPRTVSLNDPLAEVVGTLLGLGLGLQYGPRLLQLWRDAALRRDPWFAALGLGYALGFVALSLFPYDLLLSVGEWQAKLASPSWSWWLVHRDEGLVVQGLRLGVETLLSLPLGLALAWRHRHTRGGLPVGAAMRQGALLGLFIEGAQLFMASGVSQGLSVLTRALGMGAGAWLWQRRAEWTPARLRALLLRWRWALALPYAGALMLAHRWLGHGWQGLDHAQQQLAELRWLPLYYHYYTTEMQALYSLASTCIFFAPLALYGWAARWSGARCAITAALLSLVMESGRLLLAPTHPDPSNLWIAAVSAAVLLALLRQLEALIERPDDGTPPPSAAAAAAANPAAPQRHRHRRHAAAAVPGAGPGARLLALALALFALWGLAQFPLQPVLLGLLLLLCAWAAAWRPLLALGAAAAALPVLDLAPWSGRWFLDEYDLLMATLLAVAWWRAPAPARPDRAWRACAAALVLALGLSCAVALWPWSTPDANSWNSYLSPYNALRIGKGALWALLWWPLLARWQAAGQAPARDWAGGALLGLALTLPVLVWERALFGGVAQLGGEYRVTGLVSAMHVGGAYIECSLVVALLFAADLALQARSRLLRALCLLLLLAGGYGLAVTYSRAGLAAMGLGMLVLLAASLWPASMAPAAPSASGRPVLLRALAAAAMLAALLLPVWRGEFAQQRLSNVESDAQTRAEHRQAALDLLGGDAGAWLTGLGLGRFPAANFWAATPQQRSGSFALIDMQGWPALRLAGGQTLYLEQAIAPRPGEALRLTLQARSDRPGTVLRASVCEKWLISSLRCREAQARLDAPPGQWQKLSLSFAADSGPAPPWWQRAPHKLALSTPAPGTLLDLATLSLDSESGRPLLRNGDFQQGLDRWFFSSDHHLLWHAKSLPVTLLLETGVLGAAAFAALGLLALVRAARAARQRVPGAAALLAALVAVLALGLFDTLVDSPRFLFLLLMLCGLAASLRGAAPSRP